MVAPKQFTADIPDPFASFDVLLNNLTKAADELKKNYIPENRMNLEIHVEVAEKALAAFRQRATELETRASLLLNRIKKMR
ncbi:MAG TPA: hypothetical protein PKB02_13145 [Anaerohalosphaeraceae bacterium]|nr:hypothetical protein [Anaerohalosphaeraceae bacterium]